MHSTEMYILYLSYVNVIFQYSCPFKNSTPLTGIKTPHVNSLHATNGIYFQQTLYQVSP